MSARRKNGAFVSVAVTEAARRQLMTPVPCWELQWRTPDCVAPGSSLKVLKWVKTEAQQQFSDDEEADDALAPLPEEPEGAEVEDDDAEDDVPKSDSNIQSRDTSEPRLPPTEFNTAPPSPKQPHPLSHSMIPDLDGSETVVDLEPPQPPPLDLVPDEVPEGIQILDPTMDPTIDEEVLGMIRSLDETLDEPTDSFVVDPIDPIDQIDQTMEVPEDLILSLTNNVDDLEKFS